MHLPTWEVDLDVYGPVTVKRVFQLNEPKGFSLPEPFQSDIRIKSGSSGIHITATAYASNIQNARKVTLVFIGQMLDTLNLVVNLPIYLSYAPVYPTRSENFSERRLITEDEWHEAFHQSRLLALVEPTFLRSLGWYRKGLCTEDILDSFLAYWNAIEIVASKYHPDNDEAKKGTKSQIWECFKQIWGECLNWPVIAGQENWIDNNYSSRIAIAHGTEPITVDSVEETILKLPIISEVAYKFLSTWRQKQLNPKVPPDLQHQFGYL